MFDIPDAAPGMYNITSYEFYVLRSENNVVNKNDPSESFKGNTVMFSYVGTLEKGGRNEDYDVDYWDDENDPGDDPKLIFALCSRHGTFFKTIPHMGSEEGIGNIKPYKWIDPILYTEEQNQNNG